MWSMASFAGEGEIHFWHVQGCLNTTHQAPHWRSLTTLLLFIAFFLFFLINLCWKIDSDILCHRLNLFPISCPNNEKYTSAFSPGPLLTFSEGSGTQHRGWCFLDVWSQGEATCFHNSSANIWLRSPKWGFAKLTSQKPVDLSLGKQTKIFWRV